MVNELLLRKYDLFGGFKATLTETRPFYSILCVIASHFMTKDLSLLKKMLTKNVSNAMINELLMRKYDLLGGF